MTSDIAPPPVFTANTTSARHIYSLLRCIGFDTKASIQITSDGLRVTVEDSHVMQGVSLAQHSSLTAHAFIDKALFNSYTFSPPSRGHPYGTPGTPGASSDETIIFGVSLTALLECLQIFGTEAARDKWGGGGGSGVGGYGGGVGRGAHGGVFDQQVLRIGGSCKFSYDGVGSPLFLTLEESGITTTCELATWEPEILDDIPIARDAIGLKIIMKAGWLFDAIQELDATSVTKLNIVASPQAPYFSLSAGGPLGSTVVEFSNDRSLLETFQVPEIVQHSYKFALIKHAVKAMAASSKVSIRGDNQGTLSMQFMIEQEGGGPSFIDFRFVSYATDSSDEE